MLLLSWLGDDLFRVEDDDCPESGKVYKMWRPGKSNMGLLFLEDAAYVVETSEGFEKDPCCLWWINHVARYKNPKVNWKEEGF